MLIYLVLKNEFAMFDSGVVGVSSVPLRPELLCLDLEGCCEKLLLCEGGVGSGGGGGGGGGGGARENLSGNIEKSAK